MNYYHSEGGATYHFIKDNFETFKDFDVLEIGPKHGLHTFLVDSYGPKSITLVELPEKDISWTSRIKSNLDIKIGFIQNTLFDKKFDCILFCGVLYHNIDQMNILVKLNSLLKEGGYMVLESATSRNIDIIDKCVIEVHHPERYRDTKTIKFMPTKAALKAMIEISGFEILAQDEKNPERENFICKKISKPDRGYEDAEKLFS